MAVKNFLKSPPLDSSTWTRERDVRVALQQRGVVRRAAVGPNAVARRGLTLGARRGRIRRNRALIAGKGGGDVTVFDGRRRLNRSRWRGDESGNPGQGRQDRGT
jgi:hypothetical protein